MPMLSRRCIPPESVFAFALPTSRKPNWAAMSFAFLSAVCAFAP